MFTKRINECYGRDIDKQKCFRIFIDAQFKETSSVIMGIAKIYFFFMVIPFFAQLFLNIANPSHYWWVVGLNVFC